MSSAFKENLEFVARFIEICGTNQPQKIAKQLGITASAVKNYLDGTRLPETKILIIISEKTSCSIDWLINGKGNKYTDDSLNTKKLTFFNHITKNIEPALLDEINNVFASYNSKKEHTFTDSPKMVKLTPDKIREEKVTEEKTSDLPSNPS